ncbi:MAG TPA: hypothetical protein DCQ06_01585 [Myxococcales bacterium]|nr:hypothetical protein [Myxococcales bacterium]HAN30265.1 hypothetical protein [Myxococcales bacterium]
MSISRRDFLSLVGTSVAGAAAVTAGSQLIGRQNSAGQAVNLNEWQVSEVGSLDRGAVPFTLRNARTGESLRVDACRRSSGGRTPVASSRELDLFLHNNGAGSEATQREHQLVTRALAKRLDAQQASAMDTMLTMDARLDRHPDLHQTNDDPVFA